MIRYTLIATALMALAGCDRTPSQTTAPAANVAAAVEADRALIARMEALPKGQLDIVLFRAIRDAKQPCQGIAASRRLDDQAGRPAWSAQCDRGDGRFLLVLNPDGLMTVTAGSAFVQP